MIDTTDDYHSPGRFIRITPYNPRVYWTLQLLLFSRDKTIWSKINNIDCPLTSSINKQFKRMFKMTRRKKLIALKRFEHSAE